MNNKKNVVDFSDEQKAAIKAIGNNYLVSAGAGSGKTAVLTERIYRLAKQDKTLDRFLVLTFTNLAAGEMKGRVREKLLDDPETVDMASEVDNAHIETFDSFSLYLAKKYFYALGISKDLNIVDGSIIMIKRKMILDEVIDEHLINNDKDFEQLVLAYSTKNLDKIKDYIINILDKCDKKGNKEEFFAHLRDDFYNDAFIKKAIDEYYSDLLSNIKYVRDAAYELDDADDASKIIDQMEDMLLSSTYDELYEKCRTLGFPRRSSKVEDSPLRSSLQSFYNKKIKVGKEQNNFGFKDEIASLYLANKNYAIKVIEIAEEVERRLDDFKNRSNAYSFGDIARFVLKLLENENIRKEISDSFDYIMVDEYQDTNDIQDKVVAAISKNNVYMVGDVKQSIYRFRGADCHIFQEKYKDYRNDKGGRELDLNKSFRSRREVVDFINELFEDLMNKDFNAIDYSDGHKFEFGQTNYENIKTEQSFTPEIYTYEYEKSSESIEIEAKIIANDIARRHNSHYQVFDLKKNEYSDCKYKDFAIIIDRATDFDVFHKALSAMNIPVKVLSKEKLFKSDIIVVVKNLLKLLYYSLENNYEVGYKHAYFSVARSFLLEYPDDKLYNICKEDIYLLEPFAQKIELFKESLRFASLKTVLSKLYEEFSIYDSVSRIANYYANVHKIEHILTLAENMDVLGYTLADFIKYFDDLAEMEIDIDYRDNDVQADAVTLITIHGSKGLEYNVVYYPELIKQFNREDIKSSFLVSDKYGLAMPYNNAGQLSSLFIHLIKEEVKRADFEEKLRLLYVALTRAKEKIIMLIGEKSKEKGLYKPVDSICMKDLLYISNRLDKYKSSYSNYASPVLENKKEEETTKITLKTIHIPAQLIKRERASKETSEEVDSGLLDFGTELHTYLEYLDFESDDLSYIADKKMRKYIYNVKNSVIFKGVKNSQIRHEYKFFDDENNLSGSIDALIIKEDEVLIVDFKLKKIDDEEYDRQLRVYKRYISTITKLPIKMFLLAAITGEIREVKDE